jgi:phage shock protein PspC (stress-responsive transcriptional regulator)
MPQQATPEPPLSEAPRASNTVPNSTPPHEHRLFTWIRSLGLVRQPGWIGGVSAGIADRLGVDVLVVRGILVVVALLGGPAVLLYAIAWLVLPDAAGRIHLEELIHGRIDTPVVGIAILVALSLLPISQGFWWFGSQFWGSPVVGDPVGRVIWTLVILGLLIWFVVWFTGHRSHRRTGPGDKTGATQTGTPTVAEASTTTLTGEPVAPAAPAAGAAAEEIAAWRASQDQWKADHEAYRLRQAEQHRAAARAAADAAQAERAVRAATMRERRRRTRSHPLYSLALVGAALLAGAISTLIVGAGRPGAPQWLIGAAVALGVLGLGIIINGALGHRSGGASAIAVLLALILLVPAVFPQDGTRHYFGAFRIAPTAHAGTGGTTTYLQGIGSVRVDLASYYSTPRPKFTRDGGLQSYNQINLVVASGDVTIVLPADEYESIDAATAGGYITATDGTRVAGQYVKQINLPGDPKGERDTRQLDVDIHVLHGNITFIEQGADQ